MPQNTFTEKLVSLLISGDMPKQSGPDANESGLIILTSKNATPVVASYGSSRDAALAITHVIDTCESIRAVLVAAVFAYASAHPEDPMVAGIKEFMK